MPAAFVAELASEFTAAFAVASALLVADPLLASLEVFPLFRAAAVAFASATALAVPFMAEFALAIADALAFASVEVC